MTRRKTYRRLLAVGVGLVAGLVLGKIWPSAPLYAVATDRVDTYSIATGQVDNESEAVYLLDFLTGDLRALVLGKAPGVWTGSFNVNVAADMNIDPQKNPKFMMVTGIVNLRRSGGTRVLPSNAICYVAEITSGQVAAYAIPWSFSLYQAGQMQSGPLVRVGLANFRVPLGAAGPTVTGGNRGR